MAGDTAQKTESIKQLVESIDKDEVVLPEFQRDFVWEESKTHDLFDSLIRDIFVGSLIFGVPTFELTVRELDMRPRKIKGKRRASLRLTEYTKEEINQKTKSSLFRLLLDGQQRVTSIYRALKDIDKVWVIIKNEDELHAEVPLELEKRNLEEVLYEVSGRESLDRLSILLGDVYQMLLGKIGREKDKQKLLEATAYWKKIAVDEETETALFNRYLTYTNHLLDLLKGEKLLSYYLLDTSEEKFALFFERSNSKGIQLDFLDILSAKLYSGFNLRKQIEEFESSNPNYKLNGNTIVRSISYLVSGGKEMGRQYILSSLGSEHFRDHWDKVCRYYRQSLDYLYSQHFLVSQQWLPYENMLIPMILFLSNSPGNDFTQMNDRQRRFLKFWYWSVTFSQRYSSGSLDMTVLDSGTLMEVAQSNYCFGQHYFRRFEYVISNYQDLMTISKKPNAVYRGVFNLIYLYSAGTFDWNNNSRLTANSTDLEDHHIFPIQYLKEHYADLSETVYNSVLNRALIPKIQNIKIGKKPPGVYLMEILQEKNPELAHALGKHLIPGNLIYGDYDDRFEVFMEDRGKLLMDFLTQDILYLKHNLEAELFP